MAKKINVAILDDHQPTLDGYNYRLGESQNIEVVATASYGKGLDALFETNSVDALILDVSVPTSPDNQNPFPILHSIPRLLQKFPELAILIISMHNQRTLIISIMEAGASGYILKDDHESIKNLGEIINSVVDGGIYFSQKSYQLISGRFDIATPKLTSRQSEALSIYTSAPNLTTAELAEKMNIAHSTARNTLSGAYMRLGVRNRSAAIAKARDLGLITPNPPQPDKNS